MTTIESIGNLQALSRDLAVFSPDCIGMLKNRMPETRFNSEIIDVLIEARKILVTASLAEKFNNVKSGLIEYIDQKIEAISSSEGKDPWIVLKDHFSGTIEVTPETMSDHLQDVLAACYIVAKNKFDRGAAVEGNEILKLRNELLKTYLPVIRSLPEEGNKQEILKQLESLDGLLEEMGTELKEKHYQNVLDSYEKIQLVLAKTSRAAKEWENP